MKSYPAPAAALLDALRLTSGMTYKFAVPNLPRGGGRAVIDMPANFAPDLRPALLQRYGALVRQLNGLFLTGPEVCISPAAMDIISSPSHPAPRHLGWGVEGSPQGVRANISLKAARVYAQLAKTYGWGLHFNAEGRVALVPVESADYRRLAVIGRGSSMRIAVIDVSNAQAPDAQATQHFFAAATRNLLAAEQRAQVRHHVLLSIVGVDRLAAGRG